MKPVIPKKRRTPLPLLGLCLILAASCSRPESPPKDAPLTEEPTPAPAIRLGDAPRLKANEP